MSDTDTIARKLDFMRADIEEPGSSPAARLIAGHAALLLGSVEAVLKAADEAHVMLFNREYWREPSEPVAWDLDPDKLRADITAALTGEEAGDAV
jgi:hypothetical protein